ncbi:non-heme iron oxygenase ferredoxin subunit [Candidatus Woesearchaeota archaeon]|nr:non-heme iron oxygenase ferredoxin subunit [Candidatus Woesearchaeota archaeon]
MDGFIEITTKDRIPNGQGRMFEVKGIPIAIFNIDGEFYAINNTCPHRAGNLSEGYLSGSIVTCPLHAWEFDVKSGNSPAGNNIKVASYKVKIEGDKILVSL